MNDANTGIHPLRKGDDVFTASAGHHPYGGYPSDAKIRINKGVVTGGGDTMVIIRWEGVQQLDRRMRYQASRALDVSAVDAVTRLRTELHRAYAAARAQVDIIDRLRRDLPL